MLAALLCAVLLAHPLPAPFLPDDPKVPVVPKEAETLDEKPIVAGHRVTLNGKPLEYNTTVGFMPIRSKQGEIEGRIFYTAYTKKDVPAGEKRPLMFCFNGGPGSASLWLHIGTIGPKRIKMLDDGNLPPPPYQLVENETTWLDKTDLVFIDPIGTGYSRPAKPELGAKFWGVQGDIESVGEFVRMYISRNTRWDSPLFVTGESYGTTRASGLSEYLLDRGIALNGVALISSVLDFGLDSGDMACANQLPTMTAAAWYHKKLPGATRELKPLLAEVEKWADSEYRVVLAKGDALPAAEREEALNKLVRYTGLEKRYLDNANLRVDYGFFMKELLRDRKQTIGRYDSRLKGNDENGVTTEPEYDASYAAVRAPFTTAYNQYVRGELGFQTDTPYFVLGEGINAPWNWGPGGPSNLNVATRLRSAMTQNPYMKVFVAAGHYDFATPYFTAKYTFNHLNLLPALRKNITFAEYEAGHMMYIESASRAKLKADIAAWIDSALENKPAAK